MQPPLYTSEIRLLEGVQGYVYVTLGNDSTLGSYELLPGMTVTSGVLSQALSLDDNNKGALINGRISIDSNGPGNKPIRIVYNGGSFPSNNSFTLIAKLNDIAWVGLNKPDVFTAIDTGGQIQGASIAWTKITPIARPSVASVTPTSLVADGKDQAIHVNLANPVDPTILPTLSAAFAPSSAFLAPSRQITGLTTANGPVIQEQRNTNGMVTGWIIYFATDVTPSSASVSLSVSASPTYLKGDTVLKETIEFYSDSVDISFQKDQSPPEVVSMSFDKGDTYTSDPGGSSAILTGSSGQGVPYVISKGKLRITALVRSLQKDFGSVEFELRDYKRGPIYTQKSSGPSPAWGSAISSSNIASEVDPQDQKLYYKRSYTWEIILSGGDLHIQGLSHIYGIKFTARDASGNESSLSDPTMIFDGNIYVQSNLGKVYTALHPTYPNVSKTVSNLSSGLLESGYAPTLTGWFSLFASEYQMLRLAEAQNGVPLSGFVTSCDLWLDGTLWKSSSTVSSDADYGYGWSFGPLDSRGLTNGPHRLDFEFKTSYGTIAKYGINTRVSNSTGGSGGGRGGGCVDYVAQVLMGDLSTKNAIDVSVGDMVMTQNPLSGELEVRPVGEVLLMGTQPCYLLTFSDGNTHVCSATHRIFVADNHSYMESSDLEIGMTLIGPNGPRMLVSVKAIEPRQTLTFRIDDPMNKNYFADGVLAHNMKSLDCVLPGTLCTMADGSTLPVEDVLPGDMVMTFDESTQTFTPGRVLSLFATKNGDLLKITLRNGKEVTCSKTHVLFSKGWVPVSKLGIGAAVLCDDGSYSDILWMEPVKMNPDTIVHIMEVEGNHNLVLGGIVCHNYIKTPYDQVDLLDRV